jgi:hypothetical protein
MPRELNLPVDLTKDGAKRTADTPSDYWDLVARGFSVSPQAKAAATRKAKASEKAQEEKNTSHDRPEPKTDAGTNQT